MTATIVYILLEDGVYNTHSKPEPFGVGVTSEEEAKKFVSAFPQGRSYQTVRIFDRTAQAMCYAFPNQENLK